MPCPFEDAGHGGGGVFRPHHLAGIIVEHQVLDVNQLARNPHAGSPFSWKWARSVKPDWANNLIEARKLILGSCNRRKKDCQRQIADFVRHCSTNVFIQILPSMYKERNGSPDCTAGAPAGLATPKRVVFIGFRGHRGRFSCSRDVYKRSFIRIFCV
ncbi:hypothetical protein EV132_108206 [Rhizobium sullae]|uniref:Uncharacterized protein n=1 Tax=Rhizobium sullae TaxID=50338 RepID=A0A4R3QA13_RHISU|nr:hypothetical protein EV132_108206 [Rhizobium sullae]